jgi:pectate lyase
MLYAQDSASVAWDLTANTVVSRTVGAVSGSQERFSSSSSDSSLNLQVRDYSAAGGGQRLNLGQKSWPYETAENASRFVQFSVTPEPGKSLRITSLSFDMGGGGTGAMCATVYCAIDSTFLLRVLLQKAENLPNGAWLAPSPVCAMDVEVHGSQSFYVRISPWYNSTNASTSKYLYLRNVVITGVTTAWDSTGVPMVSTAAITGVGPNTATCGGTILWDGGSPVTARGVCWSTSPLPIIQNTTTTDGSGVGAFISTLTGLVDGTQYYVRAYATNAIGTGYGNERAFVARSAPPPQLAFPGAEGFGKYTIGGRGGAVFEVTNLNDSGPGSLRAAISASGPRTVVFRLSGTITLNSDLTIHNPYITIAGQTAPGDGICIRKYPLVVDADQVIVRHLRVRLGDESGGESDAMSARWRKNIIIDHCSASWSQDETLSFYWCDSLTVQWCLITESLYNSNHPKGAHGYGGIWGGTNSTYHHNLLAHHSSRNPRFASGSGNTDHRNNVIYNWGFNSAYGGEAHDSSWASPLSTINIVANYYKPGPATKSGVLYRIVNPSTRNGLADYGFWHVNGNVVEGYPNATADNWTYGVQGPSASDKGVIRSDAPFTYSAIGLQTAEQAYQSVLANVGATLPRRDSTDLRVLNDVVAGTAKYEGPGYRTVQGFPPSAPTTGIIDSQTDVGGWPSLNSTPAPLDTDHDGMPDDWETAHGLSLSDPGDRNTVGEDGYTNLEKYLNTLGLLTGAAGESPKPESMILFPCYPNPFNPLTTIRYTVAGNGHEAMGSTQVKLAVYDLLGREVAVLVDERKDPGSYLVVWNANGLSSGIYFSVLESDGRGLTEKMVLMK